MDTGFFFKIYRKIVLTIVPLNAEVGDCEGGKSNYLKKKQVDNYLNDLYSQFSFYVVQVGVIGKDRISRTRESN
jgi:hypothetical protein